MYVKCPLATNAPIVDCFSQGPRGRWSTDYGVCVASRRDAEEDTWYIRITQFLMPYHTMTGTYGENPMRPWRGWVPIDDEHTLVLGANFHPLRPLTAQSLGIVAPVH